MDSVDTSEHDRVDELQALRQENARLKRINAALIERVESCRSYQSEAYASFKHSVVLAEQVRERTDALSDALHELKTSNALLTQASHQAQVAHQHLVDAIDSISDGFVLFDAERKIVLFNRHFESFWQQSTLQISKQMSMQTLNRVIADSGMIAEKLRTSTEQVVYRLNNGRWLQVTERPTLDGGLVVVHTDITDLKLRETRRRERELAQKTRLLQQTVDNLSQGVALVSAKGVLELCNYRFLQLANIAGGYRSGMSFAEVMRDSLLPGLGQPDTQLRGMAREHHLDDGHVLEVRLHVLADGSSVHTLGDITERYRHAEALRESEHWIRMITDHVPAMIAYVRHDFTYSFVNKVYEQWYNWPHNSALGSSLREAHRDEHFRRLQPYISRALQGETLTFEVAETSAGGKNCHMQRSYVPNRLADGSVDGIFVMVKDITERHRNAEALHQAYQHLEERVRERTRELTELNAQLVGEVEERRLAEARLREAKHQADEANLSKTKFLAAVSHDLLQPLNAARLFTSALVEQEKRGADAQSMLKNVSNSLDDVENLLGTLVDISKLDAGVITADIGVFAAEDLLSNLAVEYREMARSAGLQLDFVSSSMLVKSDIHLLARVLRNFLSNAIRYTGQGGRILLGCRRTASSLWIEVWDTGAGIPEDKLDEIFLEFKRGDSQRQDRGLGLGLAIVDKISRILQHRLRVRSRPGHGSVFAIEVPLGHRHELGIQAKSEYQGLVLERLQGARIWVLDNDAAICLAMRNLLEGWGCEVVTALSEAHLAEQTAGLSLPVDVLIVDYHLDDEVDGVGAIARINARLVVPVPALMITANYSNELKQEMRQLGHTLMHKPVKPMRLKTTLNHLLG